MFFAPSSFLSNSELRSFSDAQPDLGKRVANGSKRNSDHALDRKFAKGTNRVYRGLTGVDLNPSENDTGQLDEQKSELQV